MTESSTQLRERINRVLGELQSRLREIVALLGDHPDGPTQLGRSLGIDTPLASRLLRLTHAADPDEAIALLPTINQLRRVVELSEPRVPAPVCGAAGAAVDRFAELVEELGGDQSGFESLVSILTGKGVPRVELANRRAAYRANAHVWGMHTDAMSQLILFTPPGPDGVMRGFGVIGYVGARNLRSTGTFRFRQRFPGSEGTDANPPVAPTGLPGANPAGAPRPAGGPQLALIPEFSTLSDASVELGAPDADGFAVSTIRFGGLKRSDAVTVFARTLRSPTWDDAAPGERFTSRLLISRPTEQLTMELALPAGISDPSSVQLRAFAKCDEPVAAMQMEARDELPLVERPRFFGDIRRSPAAPHVPRNDAIFEWALRAAGVGVEQRYDLYRAELDCPMLHGVVTLGVALR
ncbi:MAG: hypothetical protein K2Q20_06445 [Phycisphaerales bacterium]|nr:hypothetical protein [Phycisphaerales bacterium]